MTTRIFFAPLLFLLTVTLAGAAPPPDSSAAASMDQKVQRLQLNAARPQPDETPTTFTQLEINDYAASPQVKLPRGVQSVRFSSEPQVITGTARVDFDQLRNGRSSANPLLSVFSGVHDVVVVARGHGAGHVGYVQVQSVTLDGVEVPRFVLQLFVEKYLQPKYPNVGLDSQFSLPYKIDTAAVGQNQLTVTQK
jgi:hypothetical protein